MKSRNYESRYRGFRKYWIRHFRKSVTLGIFNGKFQFGDCQNIRYLRIRYFRNPLYNEFSRYKEVKADDAVMQVSIEKSHFNEVSLNNDVKGADVSTRFHCIISGVYCINNPSLYVGMVMSKTSVPYRQSAPPSIRIHGLTRQIYFHSQLIAKVREICVPCIGVFRLGRVQAIT